MGGGAEDGERAGAMTGRVAGKVALVTGGASGIGLAIAKRLAQEGAQVVLADLDGAAADSAAQSLCDAGGQAWSVPLDVRNEDQWRDAVQAILARAGQLDIVVNNAGIALPPPAEGFEALSLADWRRVMQVNLDGTFLGTREAVRAMGKNGAAVINIGSVAAYVGTPGGAAYGASKGGVRTLTKQAAAGCARKGYPIRINAVHPSWVWTPMMAKAMTDRFGADKATQALRDLHPFGELAMPDDVAHAVLFLASDEARMVNRADLMLDAAMLCV